MAGFFINLGDTELNYDTDTPGYIEVVTYDSEGDTREPDYVLITKLKDFVDTALEADKETK